MRRATTLVAGFLTLLLIAGAAGVEDGAGALSGVLETPDQVPGKRIPITTVTSADGRLNLDLQDLAAIKAALADNPDATVMKLDGLNHPFQTAETGAIGEYGEIAETFSPVALDVISGWIKQRF